ncbi:hypothetical protein [Pseudomonas kulmbachensis]|uniref:Uncharacterized protein n=1 Tax=Pseudomonas kulmbachensis TaxID=3043408 RepID=A0ABW7LWS4_9PSED
MNTSAEHEFRAAFERLKVGSAMRLEAGSNVSQNNVAKEAGRDPSALKKSRYPKLIADIQEWNRSSKGILDNVELHPSDCGVDQEAYIDVIITERDLALSKLILAHARILELLEIIERLEETDNEHLRHRR